MRENPILKSMGSTDITKRKVKIFDTDLKLLIKECESLIEAADYCGISHQLISYAIKHKSINKTNKLNLKLAFR